MSKEWDSSHDVVRTHNDFGGAGASPTNIMRLMPGFRAVYIDAAGEESVSNEDEPLALVWCHRGEYESGWYWCIIRPIGGRCVKALNEVLNFERVERVK